MKKCLLFIFILVLLTLCACANASLTYTLSDAHNVSVDYSLSLDETIENAADYLDEISAYWAELGFELMPDSGAGALHGQKIFVLENAKEAAEQFAMQITADETVFYDVTFTYTPSFETDEYNFSASVSLNDVIRQSKAQGISAEQVSEVLGSAADGSYSISIALPGEVVSTNADSAENGMYTWNIPFGETRQLLLHTIRTNTENLDLYASLKDKADANQTFLIVCVVAAAIFVLAAVLTGIVRRARRRRASKVRVKQFR